MKELNLNEEMQKLKQLMIAGKIKIPKEMGLELLKVKAHIDGNVIPETVSSKVRSLLLALYGAYEGNQ